MSFAAEKAPDTPGTLTLNDYYDLMRYYAYGECIETRVTALNLDRAYVDFLNSVYRYASLLFAAPGTFTALELENRKKDMWRFAWENQWLYLRLLKGRVQRARAESFDLNEFQRTVLMRRGMVFSAIRDGYKKCVDIDQTQCSYVRQIEDRGASSSARIAFNPDTWRGVTVRVLHMNKILKLLRDADRILMQAKEKPAPAAVAAGISAFVSRLGQALILQYIRPDDKGRADERRRLEDESNSLLEDSMAHLERALFDAYQEILIGVISHIALFRDSGYATEEWWNRLTATRKMEHDNKRFCEKLTAYQQLEPGVHGFLDYAQSLYCVIKPKSGFLKRKFSLSSK